MKLWSKNRKNKLETCPNCKGKGKVGGKKCESCGGAGLIMLGDVSRTIAISNAQGNTQHYQRTANDIQIFVLEGLSGTRQIAVSAWSKEDAYELFEKVRAKLGEK